MIYEFTIAALVILNLYFMARFYFMAKAIMHLSAAVKAAGDWLVYVERRLPVEKEDV